VAIGLTLSWTTAIGVASLSDAHLGGDATVFDDTRDAFSRPAPNLRDERRAEFFVGNSFFNQNWIIAPASVSSRDGLGPLFNARSCSTCHFKDGRGRPPESGEPMRTMLLRISRSGIDDDSGGPRPDPVYGGQIQGDAVPGVPVEADVLVRYDERPGAFADGEPFSLRMPAYTLANAGYGAISPDLLTSPRVAPAIVGLGLLEAVPESTLRALADPDDANADGISGRLNIVRSRATGRFEVGRFGWKAEQPSVREQVAGAFAGDMGLTSSIVRRVDHTDRQAAAASQPSGGDPEVSDQILNAVATYASTLAVPAARRIDDAEVRRGRDVFESAGCGACHTPRLVTGTHHALPEFANQTIRPYTDLLLHDMGDGLADGRPTFAASGREWRTPPLWGLGLLKKVNGHTFLLHDGRARSTTEAILWHGGEAAPARERFRVMSARERAALIAFLESL
jgi:CxxC motif-containing protein (DUF1111 family)